jgi:hypothetical protein
MQGANLIEKTKTNESAICSVPVNDVGCGQPMRAPAGSSPHGRDVHCDAKFASRPESTCIKVNLHLGETK